MERSAEDVLNIVESIIKLVDAVNKGQMDSYSKESPSYPNSTKAFEKIGFLLDEIK